jgi:hypothetical protein
MSPVHSQAITREQSEAMEFVAILLMVASALERNRTTVGLPLHETVAIAIETQGRLLALADIFFPPPGEMERRVIAFADRLGLDIREHYVSAQSNTTH